MNIVIQYNWRQLAALGVGLIIVIGGVWYFVSQKESRIPIITSSTPKQTVLQQKDSIDVDVTRTSLKDGEQVFRITLNTHSGDLSTYDAQANIVYRTNDGKELKPTSVSGDKESHHRTIEVSFSKDAVNGTLLIRKLGTISERIFSL